MSGGFAKPGLTFAVILALHSGCFSTWVHGASADGWPFIPGHVLQAEIEMKPEHWDALRKQTRSKQQGPWGKGCFCDPVPTPFSYFPARLRLDGRVMENVAVRKKGMYGSLDDRRPSLKINFSKFSKGRRLAGLKKLTLNNSKQDPSLVRQCLGYELFRKAGVVAPRCGFVHLVVNGASLGVYVNVESIDKGFIKRHLGDGSLCLEEGAVSDLRPGWVRSFDRKFGSSQLCRHDLDSLVKLLLGPDALVERDLKKIIDLDSFFSFWAMESLLQDDDGYSFAANNFFMAKGDDGLWRFIPWGIDEIMFQPTEPCEPFCQFVRTYSIMSLRLWLMPKMRREYLSRLKSIMHDLWDEDRLEARAGKMEEAIWPYLSRDQVRTMPEAMAKLVSFFCNRKKILIAEMQMGTGKVRPFLADPPCNPASSLGKRDGKEPEY